jgi:hypothetical protein
MLLVTILLHDIASGRLLAVIVASNDWPDITVLKKCILKHCFNQAM